MKLKTFITGIVKEDAILHNGIPQIAFIGRSNVGKSSTLNSLMDTKKLVKIGKTPGKTREINLFEIQIASLETPLYLVDLPGYGYASGSKKEKEELSKLINWYIAGKYADLVVMIIDARRGVTTLDEEIITLLEVTGQEFILAVNKIDKIGQKDFYHLKQELDSAYPKIEKVYYSAKSKKHLDRLKEGVGLE